MGRYNLEGRRFGRLVAIEQAENYVSPSNHKFTMWTCKCDCGNVKVARTTHLLSGATKSCGCIVKDNAENLKKHNRIEITGNIATIYAKDGREIIVDKDDVNKVKNLWWTIDSHGYVVHGGEKTVFLHRAIIECPAGREIDHINHNKLDNRKANLRIVTRTQNNMNHSVRRDNKSGTAGVFWIDRIQRWYAYISVEKKRHNLGYFKNKEEAITARRQAEEQYFGEFAYARKEGKI